MAPNKQPVSKTVHALNSPYLDPPWPVVAIELETAIIDLLVPLLHPIGQRRDQLGKISKRKRRRRMSRIAEDRKESEHAEILQEPETQQCLTVGFNSTVRRLEALSQRQTLQQKVRDTPDICASQPLCAIFVCTSALPDVMTSSLPLLAATASLSLPSDTAIRLVPISQPSSVRIAEAMRQPQVNVLGLLRGFSATESVQDLIVEHVDAIDVPWLREAADNRYQPLRVNITDTTVGDVKHKRHKKVEK